MLGFEYEGMKNEYKFKLEIRSSQIRTSFNNPTRPYLAQFLGYSDLMAKNRKFSLPPLI